MKGERVPTESSEYEASDDERMKRRGVSGGLGRGKVMKGEEEGKQLHVNFVYFLVTKIYIHQNVPVNLSDLSHLCVMLLTLIS